ncbi:S8 family serine peptidase [Leisingera caerulea]|uniref:S8 family serine peptidase n=1 Tax=Leisingera caerulea TaxID=506591 RepID=UPI00040F6F2F|nr:S8 family serine peptidase [Leisingera caerulea]
MTARALLLISVALLSACKGGSDETAAGGVDIGPPPAPDVGDGSWTRGFVESFDADKVQAVRSLAGFIANNVAYRFRIDGHPEFSETRTVRSNALQAARLDYALSTGLTGAGQVVAMVDDGIFAGHEQFRGKSIAIEGSTGSGEHGTAVASVIAGTGQGGGALGFAPAADLYVGTMDFSQMVDWRQQAGFLKGAKAAGAIAINNSWSIDYDLGQGPSRDLFAGSAGQEYIAALRDYAKNGIVIFSMQNEYDATHAHAMAALPLSYPDLEESFLTAVNAIPEFDDDRIISATRISAGCMETGRYCLTGNGQILTAKNGGADSYGISTGTSFVAPQVAGSMALLAEAFPDLTPQQLRARLLVTADNSWFQSTGEVDFADGISHGYNSEFGHGFINLRDALLPIGSTGIPMGAGSGADMLALGRAAVAASPMSGKAVTASLSSASVVAIDVLDGVFTLRADAVAADAGRINLNEYRLASFMAPDFQRSREAKNKGLRSGGTYFAGSGMANAPDALSLAGISDHPVLANDRSVISLLTDGDGSFGLDYLKGFELPNGSFELGFTALQERGSVMGMTVPGHEASISGSTIEIGASVSRRIADRAGFRFEGRYGLAEGNGAGLVGGFEGLAYDELSVAMDLADIVSAGDVVSLSATRPAGFSGGHVDMRLPVAAAAGSVTFAQMEADVSSSSRQLDLAIEYAAPAGRRGELRLAAVSTFNAGHVAGESDQAILVGFSTRF